LKELNGVPVGHGCNIYGFLTVYLDADQVDQITLEDIEDIRQVFEKYAEKEGIKNLPIVFSKHRSNLVLD
jgi:hypothetical protein